MSAPIDKPWGGRFSQRQLDIFERLNACIDLDRRLAPFDIQGSVAHARMLAKIGVLSSGEFESIQSGLLEIGQEIATDQVHFDPQDEDIHMAIERRLTDRIGEAGRKLHTARSRNDQVATDLLLFLRSATDRHLADLQALQEVFLSAAEAAGDLYLPGYTHLQRAQPVYLAHHLLAYIEMLERDRQRFEAVQAETRILPLGSGAMAGVNYPIDRDMVAAELGFTAVCANSIDGVASRDAALSYLSAAATLGMHLSRFAGEVVLWVSQEFDFAGLSDNFASGSSLMPQKKNPDAAELIRAKASRLSANHQGLLNLLIGLPLAYNKDLQEDKHYLFDSTDTLDLILPASGALLESLHFQGKPMAAAAQQGYMGATDLADFLVEQGVPFRQAHETVGKLVAYCLERGLQLNEVPPEQLAEISPHLGKTSLPPLTPLDVMERKVSAGGTARKRVDEALAAVRKRLNEKGASS